MAEAPPPPIVPYLTVRNARSALAFYEAAFDGPTVRLRETDGGGVFHARTRIGEGLVMLYEDGTGAPECNGTPSDIGGSPVSIRIELVDADTVDATFEQSVAYGASEVHPPIDRPWGRAAQIRNPEGHIWSLAATDMEVEA